MGGAGAHQENDGAVRPDQTPSPATHLNPEDLHAWYRDGKKMLILDTRNDYEVEIGTFQGSVDPGISTFGELPEWIKRNISIEQQPNHGRLILSNRGAKRGGRGRVRGRCHTQRDARPMKPTVRATMRETSIVNVLNIFH